MAINTAGEIMDSAAALMNDTEKQTYTYTVLLPYLKIALKDFRQKAELDDFPVTNKNHSVITVPVNASVIGFNTIPALPSDLIEPITVWYGNQSAGPFSLLGKVDNIPHSIDNVLANSWNMWAWRENAIHVPPSGTALYMRIDYMSTLFTSVVDQNSSLGVINADSFLHFQTAGHCAAFIEENETRSNNLYARAERAFEEVTGIVTKGKQAVAPARRRPMFRR